MCLNFEQPIYTVYLHLRWLTSASLVLLVGVHLRCNFDCSGLGATGWTPRVAMNSPTDGEQ